MSDEVRRTQHARGRYGDVTTLSQTFEFSSSISAAAVRDVLRSAPLVGVDSIFGDRSGDEVVGGSGAPRGDDRVLPGPDGSRRLRGFSPAPGFRFDVELAEPEPGVFVASFSQPDRTTPYLVGDAVWIVGDGSSADGARLDEEINTERALSAGAEPLGGPRPSLRRWLFFRIGHDQVMRGATARIADLATR